MTTHNEPYLRQIRAQAAQAAATCAVAVGLGDASGFLRVATMIENYILEGEGKAQAVIDSWAGAPAADASHRSGAVHGGDSPSDPRSRAQALAVEASSASTAREVQDILCKAEDERVAKWQVVMEGATGTLLDYLEHLLEAYAAQPRSSLRNDLGL